MLDFDGTEAGSIGAPGEKQPEAAVGRGRPPGADGACRSRRRTLDQATLLRGGTDANGRVFLVAIG
jgi:hypothetical protein